jgi:hypothetical protein
VIIERKQGNGWNELTWYWSVRDTYDEEPRKLTTEDVIKESPSNPALLAAILDYIANGLYDLQKWRDS